MEDVEKPRRRAIASVDLGDLKAEVTQRCAAASQTPSTWLRALIQRELASDPTRPPKPLPRPRRAVTYRPWLEAELVDKLDRLCATSGFRSRTAAVRAVLDGVNVGAGGGGLGEAVTALSLSNHQLVALGRNLNQVARSLNAYPGKTTVADRQALERTGTAIRAHLEQASRLLAELRPMLKPPKDRRA